MKDLKERFGDRIPNIVPIYITAPLIERMRRSKKRSDFAAEFKKRVKNETEEFIDFVFDNPGMFVIDTSRNDKESCVDQLSVIINHYMDKK